MRRWDSVKQVYQAALDKPPTERAAFLDEACAGDAALRHDVDSLLAQGDATAFLDAPAPAVAARELARHPEGSLLGRTVGQYEVLSLIGAGGMGSVFRARDTRLGRTVALKLLPPIFAQDPDRVARFEREARMLASLNHPNVAALFGVEPFDGSHALVMELVEGETLAEQLARGRMAVDDALPAAVQIADALAAAHARGIVHRDLKPANIKRTADGRVKVLDFGLAKTAGPAVAVASSDSTHGPPSLTAVGMVVGTAAYMSPEQARGAATDEQSDVFSFGSVLYEMLAGQAAFRGESSLDIVASVITRDPNFSALPAALDPRIVHLLRRCLEKQQSRRWHAMADVRIEIEAILADPRPALAATRRSGFGATARIALAGAAALAVGAMTLMVWWSRNPRPRDSAPIRQSFLRLPVPAPDGYEFNPATLRISPDGQQLLFNTQQGGVTSVGVWLRAMNGSGLRRLDAPSRFGYWSPDSRSIVFVDANDGTLKRLDLDGVNPVTTLVRAGNVAGVAWSGDGTLILGSPRGPLRRVRAGGTPTPIEMKQAPDVNLGRRHPHLLPDGRHVLFLAGQEIWVGALDGSMARKLVNADSQVLYDGHGRLLFVRGDSLFAQRFDDDRLQMEGDAFLLESGLQVLSGSAPFAVHGDVLMYLRFQSVIRRLEWYDAAGQFLGRTHAQEERYDALSFYPGERSIATHIHDGDRGGGTLWRVDLDERGSKSKITDGNYHDAKPWVNPDGTFVTFHSTRRSPPGYSVFRQALNGPSDITRVIELDEIAYNSDYTRRWLIFHVFRGAAPFMDLWVAPVGDPSKPRPRAYVATPHDEGWGALSLDETLIAYNSNESGKHQVYVQPFSGHEADAAAETPMRKQVSGAEGGMWPRWYDGGVAYARPDAHEVWKVDVSLRNGSVVPGTPRRVLKMPNFVASETGGVFNYAVTRDGKRFLVATPVSGQKALSGLTAVWNWTEQLTK
jgi:serine/threonine protein kinase